jgi:DNA-directed RNA polymerase sigma subunit (sigma70/sigma32)
LEKERKVGVAGILDTALTESSADIIRRRFGIDEYEDDKVQTLEQIGHVYHRSRERMRQRKNEGMKTLSSDYWRKQFEGYL